MTRPRLFARFPTLASHVPWLELGTFPTPVAPLAKLGEQLGCSALYVKRDDLSAGSYGGNKVRKLEFVLADVLARRREAIVTFGAVGSNHVLATALHGAAHGIETIGIVVPQPVHPYVRRNVLCDWALGCRLEPVGSTVTAASRFLRVYAQSVLAHGRLPYFLWAGGSTTLGVLGYVEAALEIADQVHAHELPEPHTIFVPVGSAGTMAGLVLGCRLAGLKSQPVGVRVYERAMANEWTVAWMARRALAYLRRMDPTVPKVAISPRSIRVLHGYCGAGYAHPTEQAARAIRTARELEGIELETTYSGKALAGFMDYVQQPGHRDRPALFINTYNSASLDELAARCPGPQVLPDAVRGYFAGSS